LADIAIGDDIVDETSGNEEGKEHVAAADNQNAESPNEARSVEQLEDNSTEPNNKSQSSGKPKNSSKQPRPVDLTQTAEFRAGVIFNTRTHLKQSTWAQEQLLVPRKARDGSTMIHAEATKQLRLRKQEKAEHEKQVRTPTCFQALN
jgi:hypothetical protein